jgi:hypothetical protein
MKASELAEGVKAAADPHGRGRQFITTFLSSLSGTRAAGFVLTRQESAGKWNAATFRLAEAQAASPIGHRTHRTDGLEPSTHGSPMSPMQLRVAGGWAQQVCGNRIVATGDRDGGKTEMGKSSSCRGTRAKAKFRSNYGDCSPA